MAKKIRIAAFGSLNQGSYDMFREWLERFARQRGMAIDLTCAGPYPNAAAVSEPRRPLRADALKDPALKEELLTAVAADAMALGEEFDVYCMPCMSMIGFHEGVEQKLRKPIVKLADVLMNFYKDIDSVGIIHMRPAKDRIKEMFGSKAVTPTPEQSDALFAAEAQAKQDGNAAAVEAVMADIVHGWQDLGLKHALFARADAPMAQKGPAGKIEGIQINSYFELLAKAIVEGFSK